MTEYHINHYMPELGSPTAGSGETWDEYNKALAAVQQALSTAKPGHRIMVEITEGDTDFYRD